MGLESWLHSALLIACVINYAPHTLSKSIDRGSFRAVVGLGVGIFLQWIGWDPNKAIDIGEWSICGGCRLMRFYSSTNMDRGFN